MGKMWTSGEHCKQSVEEAETGKVTAFSTEIPVASEFLYLFIIFGSAGSSLLLLGFA